MNGSLDMTPHDSLHLDKEVCRLFYKHRVSKSDQWRPPFKLMPLSNKHQLHSAMFIFFCSSPCRCRSFHNQARKQIYNEENLNEKKKDSFILIGGLYNRHRPSKQNVTHLAEKFSLANCRLTWTGRGLRDPCAHQCHSSWSSKCSSKMEGRKTQL